MKRPLDRRTFLNNLGVTMGAAAAATAGPSIIPAFAQTSPPKGNIPSTPLKMGHMTFFTGPAAVLGEPSLKGHILAAEEINAAGGILGKRKIETITADEQAGTDANVKELRRMKLSEKIDLFTGVISSGNTPALGPVAEELACSRSSSTAAPTSFGTRRCRTRSTRSASPTSSRRTASPARLRRHRPGPPPRRSPTSIPTTATAATPSITS